MGRNTRSGLGNGLKTSPKSVKGGQMTEELGTPIKEPLFDFPKEVPFDYNPRPNGFGTLLEFMKRGNDSVKENILSECNVIMECRVCNNLFRSPRDFITHKDKHCTERYQRVSPAGLAQLILLAQNSFKINAGTTNASVSVVPPVDDDTSDSSDLSFDANHLVPMMSSAVEGKSKELLPSHLDPEEMELLTNTSSHADDGISRAMRQLPMGSNGRVKVDGKYKSIMKKSKAALLGPDGKSAVVGSLSSVDLIANKLAAQWERRKTEEDYKTSTLKCTTCHILCPSEKALRIHTRENHQLQSDKAERKKAAVERMNGPANDVKEHQEFVLSSEIPVVLSSHSATANSRRRKREFTLALTPPSLPPESSSENPTSSATLSEVQNQAHPGTNPVRQKKSPPLKSFRRLTNNSFSATLGSGSETATLMKSPEVETSISSPPKKAKQTPANPVEEDDKAKAKALFGDSRKNKKGGKVKKSVGSTPAQKKSPPPKKISCLNCTAKFTTAREMSSHLVQCSALLKKRNASRISILDRHDYLISPGPGRNEQSGDEGPTCSQALHFNNNENEFPDDAKVVAAPCPLLMSAQVQEDDLASTSAHSKQSSQEQE